ncbi:hypothetical protein D1007_25271 [Hordeum vulgare]|nr:hypothetical protein D1007_25271 [Hordeum vulgare]
MAATHRPHTSALLQATGNKVFEDQVRGIVCYRDDKGELVCEGYDEGRGSECGCRRRPAFHGLWESRSPISSTSRRFGFSRTAPTTFFCARTIRSGSSELIKGWGAGHRSSESNNWNNRKHSHVCRMPCLTSSDISFCKQPG